MKRLIILLIASAVQADPAFAEREMTLAEFLNAVSQQNLDLKIDQAKADVAGAKSVGFAIPPPMVGINQMNEKGGPSARGFEVSQTVPFPTKLTADHSARQDEAQAQKEVQKAGKNEVLSEAKFLFISLWADQEKLELLKEKSKVVRDHIKLSRSTVRSDSFAAVHLLKTESDQDLLENEVLAATQRLKERQLEIALVLNIDSDKSQITALEPPLSQVPKPIPMEEIPQLRSLRFGLESARSRETEARSAWFPDLSVRYKEMGATSMAGPYNEVMIGVTLPFVFFWEPSAQNSKASSERIQKEFELERERRQIDSRSEMLSSRAGSLKEQLENLTGKLIPRAEKRMRLVHNLAPRDMETLQDHRDTMEAFPDLKMKALEIRLQYEETIAELGKFFGKDLIHE